MFQSELIAMVAGLPASPTLLSAAQSCVVAKVWWVLCVHLTLLLHNTHLRAAASAWCVCLRAARVGGVHVRLRFSFLQPRAGWKSSPLVENGEAAVEGGGFIQIRII